MKIESDTHQITFQALVRPMWRAKFFNQTIHNIRDDHETDLKWVSISSSIESFWVETVWFSFFIIFFPSSMKLPSSTKETRAWRKEIINGQPDCDAGGDFSEMAVVVMSRFICGDIFVSSSTVDMLSVVLSISSNDRLFSRLPLLRGAVLVVDDWFVVEYDADCDRHAKLGVNMLAFVKLLTRSVVVSLLLLLLQYPYQPSSSFIADSAYS